MTVDGVRATLGDYFTLQRGTTYKSALLGQPGPALFGLATIQRNGGFRRDSIKTYGGDSPENLIVHPGELYVSLKDVTQSADLLGAISRVPRDGPVGRLTQDTVKLQPIAEDVPIDYVYWLLRTPQYRQYCRAHATGTTNLGLAREDFLAFPVPESSDVQCRIVGLLNALEDKIELNRKMDETLEAMAQALFKSWFVDFHPVRAKAEGCGPGLSDCIASVFPGSFEGSEVGEIPKGWSATHWGSKVTLEYGRSLAGSAEGIGSYPVYGTNGQIGTHVAPLCQHEGIIIGRKGAYRGIHYCKSPFYVIDTAFYVEPRVPMEMRWGYYELLRTDLNNLDSGSAIPSTSREDFYSIPVVWPSLEVQRVFVRQMSPVWERQEIARRESQTLTALRDALLPKLSPAKSARNAERIVEDAVG